MADAFPGDSIDFQVKFGQIRQVFAVRDGGAFQVANADLTEVENCFLFILVSADTVEDEKFRHRIFSRFGNGVV